MKTTDGMTKWHRVSLLLAHGVIQLPLQNLVAIGA